MTFMYLEYSDRVEKFDLFKNYGIDPLLQIGDNPLPKRVDLKEITEKYYFLLKLMPLEIWIKIFKQIYNDQLIEYRSVINSEVIYNITRLFKVKNFDETYRDFEISIRATPHLYKYPSHKKEYIKNNTEIFFDYTLFISHTSLDMINKLSDFLPRFTKCRNFIDGKYSIDKWSLLVNTEVRNDFTFLGGYSCNKIITSLNLQKETGKIKTFKTIDYNLSLSKNFIDNFYNNENFFRSKYNKTLN